MTDARVLIVEDEIVVAEGLRLGLQASGYIVVGHATEAAEAVRLAETCAPDVVLMDVCLDGGREGIEAARAIRQISDVALVFVSAHADEAVLKDAVGAGAFGYVVKPFQPCQITSAIEVALHRHGQANGPPPAAPDEKTDSTARDDYATMLARLETILFDDEVWQEDTMGAVPPRLRVTPRERDVVRGLVCYRRLSHVAEELGISAFTARNHLKSVFRKLNLHSQDELFQFLLGDQEPTP